MWAFLWDQMNRGASKREREKNGGKEGGALAPYPTPSLFFPIHIVLRSAGAPGTG